MENESTVNKRICKLKLLKASFSSVVSFFDGRDGEKINGNSLSKDRNSLVMRCPIAEKYEHRKISEIVIQF